MEQQEHIIGRQRITVQYDGQTDGMFLQRQINELCNDWLPARFQAVMDRYAGPDQVIRIGQLHIEAELIHTAELKEELLRLLSEKIEQALQHAVSEASSSEITRVSGQQSFAALLAFFLEQGYLPWWSTIRDAKAWQDATTRFFHPEHIKELPPAILSVLHRPAARKRLAVLLQPTRLLDFLVAYALSLTHALEQTHKDIATWINILMRAQHLSEYALQQYRQQWKEVLVALLVPAIRATVPDAAAVVLQYVLQLQRAQLLTEEQAHSFSRTVQAAPMLADALARAFQTPETNVAMEQNNTPLSGQPAENEQISTPVAGIVLLAPYLPLFMKHAELLEDNRITDPSKAVTLLHYLATGAETFEEFEVPLEKILCGIPLQEPVLPQPIKKLDEAMAHDLLSAVINHWSTLKNTSPAGLRETFLKRDGLLSFKGAQWDLNVEHRTVDVLLDHVPWNFRMIKTPWMQQLMTVNWT